MKLKVEISVGDARKLETRAIQLLIARAIHPHLRAAFVEHDTKQPPAHRKEQEPAPDGDVVTINVEVKDVFFAHMRPSLRPEGAAKLPTDKP